MTPTKLPRRTFVKRSAATVVAAVTTTQSNLSTSAYAAGSDTLRLGVVGCGGRGSGAVKQALQADAGVRLVAMADAFEDRLAGSLKGLTMSADAKMRSRIDVPRERQYAGFDAYKHVIDQVDVVILAATPHFRPRHLQYAVEKGRHIFAEKPVATDSVGLRTCLAACAEAKKKNLTLVSGLCWRYHPPRIATIQRVREGAIGDIVAVETTYNSGGVWEPRRKRAACDSEMEYQMRNWYYYTWLSGDHICEQAVHGLDTMGWVLGDQPPLRCWGTGGRQARTAPRYGNIYDHFALVYEYPNNVRGYHSCRHWPGADTRVRDYVLGSKGSCDVFGSKITGETSWRFSGKNANMYQAEHDELFKAIRTDKPVNDGSYMCGSTLLAIMGRMAAYTGKTITWDMALNAQESLGPENYAWGDLPQRPVARPGAPKTA
jgi:predicted dehydrogenase